MTTHNFGAIWAGWRLWPELLPGRLSPCAVMLDQRITKLSTSVNLMSNSVSDRVTKMCKKIGDLGVSGFFMFANPFLAVFCTDSVSTMFGLSGCAVL